jgi:hydrogenase-4 component F
MILIVILAIPLLAAGLSLIPLGKKFAPVVTLIGVIAILIASLHVALQVASGNRVVTIQNWMSCDGLSALVLLLISFVGLTAALFSWGYIEKINNGNGQEKLRYYYANYNLFLLSMLAVPLFVELALVWIAVELTTLLSVLLVGFENTREALEAAWKYIVLTLMGATIALLGFLILFWGLRASGGNIYTWEGLIAAAPNMPPVLLQTAFLLILIGFGAKAGLVPLHTWLPDAHSQAPSPVCALLSGVETTAVLYTILRLIPILNAVPSLRAGVWAVVFGLISVGVAAFLLLQVRDYKRLFAYSTVEHMGIILVATGLGNSAAHYGAVYQIFSHAITKSSCFLAAGAVLLAMETREIASVQGLIRTSPTAGVTLLLGGLAVSGAPPFAVFLSEFYILKAGISNSQYIIVGLLALFIVIAFFGIMLHINRMVFGRPAVISERIRLPISCVMALTLSVIPIVVFGVYMPSPLHDLLRLAANCLER